MWGSFLRFIETWFRILLAACREPALIQTVSIRLNPWWSFTITFPPLVLTVCPACELMLHMTKCNPTASLLILHNHHPPLLLTICLACQLMTHMTKWNSFFVLDANCQGLAASHRKICCGITPASLLSQDSDMIRESYMYFDGACTVPTNDNTSWESKT